MIDQEKGTEDLKVYKRELNPIVIRYFEFKNPKAVESDGFYERLINNDMSKIFAKSLVFKLNIESHP